MKLNDIHLGENTPTTEDTNKYIPGSSEKKRASVMYLFFGIIVSLSKKEFSPFEFYHLKQSIWLWILILPVILISFIPLVRIIWILVLVVLLAVLGRSFANAFNWKYFDNSKNIAFTLPAGTGGWFLDLFELWIKSNNPDENPADSDNTEPTLENLQNTNTTLEEDVQKLDDEAKSLWDEDPKLFN